MYRTLLFQKLLLLIVGIFPLIAIGQGDWFQIGADIDGEAAQDRSGGSVDLSADGNYVVIGAELNDGAGTDAGHVRVYENVAGTWVQLGGDINGEAADDHFGGSVSISDDGTTIAVGAENNDDAGLNAGHVRVFQLVGAVWTQVGADINGEAAGDLFGCSVELNADGTIFVAGGERNDGSGIDAGHARVYEFTAGTWSQIGADIDGELAYDWSGSGVSINNAGDRVAIGARRNDGAGSSAGHVRVYDNIAGIWTQVGADIDGEAIDDWSGSSVSLNAVGDIVAIGAPNNDGAGAESGHARVYEEVGGVWTQVGGDLDGSAIDEELGNTISLNDAGTRVAIGAGKSDIGGAETGHVIVYRNFGGVWSQIGTDVVGEALYDRFGWSAALNGDGNIFASGAYVNDGIGTSAGHVRVYELLCDTLDTTLIASTEYCLGDPVTLEAVSINGGSISWDGGVTNGVPFTPPAAGTYTYNATSDNINDCDFTIDITVFDLPVVTAAVDDDEICDGESVTFTGGGADSYTWDMGVTDGVPFTPPVGTDTYTVTGTDAATTCTNTATVDVTVHALPAVTAIVDDPDICLGESAIFTGGGADTYSWDMGVTDGVAFTPGAAGTDTYTVTGTDAITGCENTATVDLTVYDLPTVTATAAPTEICLGESIVFTGGGADSYIWDLGVTDGVAFTPAAAGTFTHTVTGTDINGCVNSATVDVDVYTTPTVTATATPSEICLGESIVFSGGGADTYTWDGGIVDGDPFTPVASGTFTYKVIGAVGATSCIDSATVEITVNDLPPVVATAIPSEICLGDGVTLSGSGADTYAWDGGVTDGVTFVPPASGTFTYTVTGTDMTTGCENTATVDIIVNENPVVDATATPTELCLGESVILTGSGADDYVWDGGVTDGTAFTPADTGTYTYHVIGTDLTTNCSAEDSVTITVYPLPEIFLSVTDSIICLNESVIFTAEGGATYDWDPAIEMGEPYTPTDLGSQVYTVTGYSEEGCENTAFVEVTVLPLPFIEANMDTVINTGGLADIYATTDEPGAIVWEPDYQLDCDTCSTTTVSPVESTTYTVYFTNEAGCVGTDTVRILVNYVDGIGVADIFSPNGDGQNDLLMVQGYHLEQVNFKVYNKYGELVFETTDQNMGWDGTFRGRPENPGVFTWIVFYNLEDGRWGQIEGTSTLYR